MSNIYTKTYLSGETKSTTEANEFFDKLTRETIKNLRKYYQNTEEAGFYFGEEQLKTYLTIALGKITNVNVMQEYPLERKKGTRRNKPIFGHGRLDYIATYKNSDFLIEVKHGWARYYAKNEKITFYKKYKYYFQGAINQIKRIHSKSAYKSKSSRHLFGLSLIVVPFYEAMNRNKQEPVPLTESIKSKLEDICLDKDLGSNMFCFWTLNKDDIEVIKYPENNKPYWESYPAVLFLGKMTKYSRERRK